MATYGEKLVEDLIKKLPKERYRYLAEIGISSPSRISTYRYADFIIIGNTLGVVVLEVKDWKHFTVTKNQVSIKRPDGTQEIEENPLQIARRHAENIHERLYQNEELLGLYKGKRKLKFPYKYALVLTHARKDQLEGAASLDIWRPGEVLGKADLNEETFEQALHNIPNGWRLSEPLSNQMMSVIYASLNPEALITDAEDNPIGILTRAQEEEIVRPLLVQPVNKTGQLELLDPSFLTPEANEIIERDSVRLVRGVAGSGKSLVLARRAKYLAQTYPELNILVIAFNKDLVHHLRGHHLRGLENIEVVTFHSICSRIIGRDWQEPLYLEGWLEHFFADRIHEEGMSPKFIADEFEWRIELDLIDENRYLEAARDGRGKSLGRTKRKFIQALFDSYITYCRQHQQTSWQQIPKRALAYLTPEHYLYGAYDAILIDEAQDFAPSWLGVIKRLLKQSGHLFMCDDPTQSLFRAYSWRSKGIEVTGRTRILRVPFRCTREITEVAYSLVESDSTLDKSDDILKPDLDSYELAAGEMPQIINCYTREQEIAYVFEQIGFLENQGIPASSIAVLCHNRHFVKNFVELRNRHVYVEHFDKMKGLEFVAVLIPYLQTSLNINSIEDIQQQMAEKRRRLYTAMTRARQTLIMSYHESIPDELTVLFRYAKHKTLYEALRRQ